MDAQAKNSDTFSHIAGKYLTFALASEEYALPILKVDEIIGTMHVTQVPGNPPYMKGVINLRGKMIPVIDLRIKLGLDEAQYNEKTCTIVINLNAGDKIVHLGVIVDTVLEVVNYTGHDVEPAPNYGSGLQTPFIMGMGRNSNGQVTILLDIDKALADTLPSTSLS